MKCRNCKKKFNKIINIGSQPISSKSYKRKKVKELSFRFI